MIEWRTVLVGIAVSSLAVGSMLAMMYLGPSLQPSQVMLINRSSETISEARLIQDDSELRMESLIAGQSQSADFISREGPITLTVKLESGLTISADKVGYLAARVPVVVVFDVTDDRVSLRAILKRDVGPRR